MFDFVVGDSVLIIFEVNVIVVLFFSSIMNIVRVMGDFELILGEFLFIIINLSNMTVMLVNRGSLDMLKEVDYLVVGVGEMVMYIVCILNIGIVDVMNV